jgi:hypothetical protein
VIIAHRKNSLKHVRWAELALLTAEQFGTNETNRQTVLGDVPVYPGRQRYLDKDMDELRRE